MITEKPIKVGVAEKATNNPPIEILVENENTLDHLPKTFPAGTIAFTRGRFQQWVFDGAEWQAANAFPVEIDDPEDGQTLVYDGESGKWVNAGALLLSEESGEDDAILLDHVWQDIFDAFIAGRAVILYDSAEQKAFPVIACYTSADDYVVETSAEAGAYVTYIADAADAKPAAQVVAAN